MGDVFKEQIVKRQTNIKDTAIRACLWVLFGLIAIAAFGFLHTSIGMIIVIVLWFGVKFLTSFLSIEYEYVLTNGELDIDIIYDRSRRKRVFTANVKSFEIMAHIQDKNHEAAFNTAQVTKDFSSGVPGPDTYVFLTVIDGKKTKVIIEPNEKMLKAFCGVLTRRNLHLRPGVVLL